MKKTTMLVSMVAFLLFVAVTGILYAESTNSLDEIAKRLKSTFPNFDVESVQETPVKGIYEVVGTGGQIIYYHPDGYVFFGELWTTTGKSITGERRQELMAKKIESLPLDKAVKVGTGKNKVITFTDPECPFCQKVYQFMSKRKDVTEYLFFLPFHNGSQEKISYLLCSKNKEKAYHEIMSTPGKNFKVSPECLESAKSTINFYTETANKLGVRGTPFLVVNGQPVYGANIPLIESLLNKSNTDGKEKK